MRLITFSNESNIKNYLLTKTVIEYISFNFINYDTKNNQNRTSKDGFATNYENGTTLIIPSTFKKI